jgi:hypothetical protein
MLDDVSDRVAEHPAFAVRLSALAAGAVLGGALASCTAFDPASSTVSGADAASVVDAGDPDAGEPRTDADVPPDGTDGGTDAGADAATAIVGCHGALACARTVFVTSAERTGAFGGVAKADQICMDEANNSPAGSLVRGREFLAWVSDGAGGASPATRFPAGTGPYRRPDGAVVAANWTALTTQALKEPINIDASGNLVKGTVWTGTRRDGTKADYNCQGFTTGNVAQVGAGGAVGATDGAWTNAANYPCDRSGHVVCVEF